jgi:hypothetical protein
VPLIRRESGAVSEGISVFRRWEPADFAVPARVRRFGSDAPIEPGGSLSPSPWDVQILVDTAETS